ncbi:tapasin-related protein-like [Erpetoichthys calabaricus]|uniref:tapasin-related protein-like n=1 Tax=Erpetoichthys calabaricus TaxID=27687 RepID=UPI00223444DA|nr:tapasin-related protein-like [Erpetoichthys calabaricus]
MTSCITVWMARLQKKIVRTAEKIIGISSPSIMDMYTTPPVLWRTRRTPHINYLPSCHLDKAAAPQFQVYAPQPEVRVHLHSEVVLPCAFTLSAPEQGLKYIIITWRRGEAELVQYKDRKAKITSKAKLFEHELQNGNASLLIPDVTIEDEGDYECEVYETPVLKKKDVQLKVTASPQVSLKSPLLVIGQINILECHAHDFYPNTISLEWIKDNKSLPHQETPLLSENSNGTFNAVSRYNYTPVTGDEGMSFCCLVNHEALDKSATEIHLQPCKPTLTVSPRVLQRGQKESVTCTLDSCLLSKATVSWKRKGETVERNDCEGVRECVCNLIVTLNYSEDFSCEGEAEDLEKPLVEPDVFTFKDQESYHLMEVITIVLSSFGLLLLLLFLIPLCHVSRH